MTTQLAVNALLVVGVCLVSCGPNDSGYFVVDASDPSAAKPYFVGVPEQHINTCTMALSLERFVVVKPKKTYPSDIIDCSNEEDRKKNHPSRRQVDLKVTYPISSDFDSTRTLTAWGTFNYLLFEWDAKKTYLVGLRKAGPDWYITTSYPIEITDQPPDDAGEPVVFGNEILSLPDTLGELSQSLEANQQDLSSCYPDPSSYPFQPRSDENFEAVTRTSSCSDPD